MTTRPTLDRLTLPDLLHLHAEVQLVPVGATARPRRQLGLLEGRIRLPEDFDEPLPEDVLRDFEGGA